MRSLVFAFVAMVGIGSSTNVTAQADIAKEYRQATKDLFLELMSIRKNSSVFEDLWFNGVLSNEERARRVSDWGHRVWALNKNDLPLRETWFDVPFIENEGFFGNELTQFITVGVVSKPPIQPIWLRELEAKFWLLIICDESPDVCLPYANKWPRYE